MTFERFRCRLWVGRLVWRPGVVEGDVPNEIAQNGFRGQGLGEWKQITIRNESPLDLADAEEEEEKRYDASHPVPLFLQHLGKIACLSRYRREKSRH